MGNGASSEARGVDDRLMWGWRSHPAPVSSDSEAVARAQPVLVLWRGLSSFLKKNIYARGVWGGGYEAVPAALPGKSHKSAENVPI